MTRAALKKMVNTAPDGWRGGGRRVASCVCWGAEEGVWANMESETWTRVTSGLVGSVGLLKKFICISFSVKNICFTKSSGQHRQDLLSAPKKKTARTQRFHQRHHNGRANGDQMLLHHQVHQPPPLEAAWHHWWQCRTGWSTRDPLVNVHKTRWKHFSARSSLPKENVA